jgi:hypothetical protein
MPDFLRTPFAGGLIAGARMTGPMSLFGRHVQSGISDLTSKSKPLNRANLGAVFGSAYTSARKDLLDAWNYVHSGPQAIPGFGTAIGGAALAGWATYSGLANLRRGRYAQALAYLIGGGALSLGMSYMARQPLPPIQARAPKAQEPRARMTYVPGTSAYNPYGNPLDDLAVIAFDSLW